jgi:UDP-N-acetylglucosamine 4,6-dehydratase (inverting)
MFDNKTILITGGTGTFGKNFAKRILDKHNPRKVIIFSRDEMKQWELEKAIQDPRLRFILGDVRDRDRLERAFKGVDIVIHAAAMKIVPKAEYDPFECVKTNIFGAMNVIDASLNANVKKVVALSTDKASSPINVYGASKLVSDKVFIAANAYSGFQETVFSVVRYGNVMGSRGSVIPLFYSMRHEKALPITDVKMTRFMITIDQGMELVEHALKSATGGEIFVKKVPSMNVIDIAKTINPSAKFNIIGIRPGEKIHEQLISSDEAKTTYDCGDFYKIYSVTSDINPSQNEVLVKSDFSYRSDTNQNWMSELQLQAWIDSNLRS